MVRQWLGAGLSDKEIIARMVANAKGGQRVMAAPPVEGANVFGFVLPFAVSAFLGVLVLALLVRVVHKGKSLATARPESTPSQDEDLWGEEIERELKEMDD